MENHIDQNNLHRGAKIFMDSGRSSTYKEAMDLLEDFGLTIIVGADIVSSKSSQTALLSLLNVTHRTLLAGIDVIGLPHCPNLTDISSCDFLKEAVTKFGGNLTSDARIEWPTAIIGNPTMVPQGQPAWRLTWEGWSGGIVPFGCNEQLANDETMPVAPVLAAAICAAEVFAFHANDYGMAGHRVSGLSLWQPTQNWLTPEAHGPVLAYLPSRLWIIGLGNLGQAISWVLACLPYERPQEVQLMLQDYDRISKSNISTSILSWNSDISKMKSRVVASWLESRGFTTYLDERRFGAETRRSKNEPGVALCGVDNANARAELDKVGFDLIIEAGLGSGPHAFRNLAIHAFPASRTPSEIWGKHVDQIVNSIESQPAYQALKESGVDTCGITQLAARTVGTPFVGLIAASLAVSEILRRLHGGTALEYLSTSALSLDDTEAGSIPTQPYAYGYVDARK